MGEVAAGLHVLASGMASPAPDVAANAHFQHDRQPPWPFACSDALVRAWNACALWHARRRLFRVRPWFFGRMPHARSRWGTMARIPSGEVSMQPVALTSATRRGARREQARGHDRGRCRPVCTGQRPACQYATGPEPATAARPRGAAQGASHAPWRPRRQCRARDRACGRRWGHSLGSVCRAPGTCRGGIRGYFNDDLYYKNLAVVSGCQVVGALVAFLGMRGPM